jgi:hypothetical protein
MEYLVIDKDGFAVNHINADADFNPGEGLHLEAVRNQPWRAAALFVPTEVALWQAKAALASIGKLDAANAMVAQIGGNVALAWEWGNIIERSSPAVERLGAALGLDLDALFIAADKLSL